MKEIGLGENLKMAGIFNFNADAENILNHQLLATNALVFVGRNRYSKTHPKERHTILLGVDRRSRICFQKR